MLNNAVKYQNDKIKVQAALHGVKLPEDDAKTTEKKVTSGGLFGDPKMYEKMTEDERNAADKNLMSMVKSLGLPITNME